LDQIRQNERRADSDFTMSESGNLMLQIEHAMINRINQMQLHNKNIIVVIGATRAGKGTLCAALQGYTMKWVKSRDFTR